MFPVNLKKAGFALKNALILTCATSTLMFVPINLIVRVLAIDFGCGVIPLEVPLGGSEILGYCWANMSLYAQIFSWAFATTLIQVAIAKKVNKKNFKLKIDY